MAEGIEVRAAKNGTRSYRASVWSNREQRRVRKTFPSLAAARSWRSEAQQAVRSGKLRAATAPLVDTAIEELLAGIDAGTVRTRGRRPFKPSTRRRSSRTTGCG
jgi:integrase